MVGPDHPGGSIFQANTEHLILWPWLFGKEMVWLFILLSGFALYWSEENRLARGRGATSVSLFAHRRAWRILPTYYTSLALGAVVVLGFGWFLVAPSPSLNTFTPVTWDGILSHVLLIHNLSPHWIDQINPPLWSIAVEVQLYVLFPVLLLLAKKLTSYGAALFLVLVAFAVNYVLNLPLFTLAQWFFFGAALAHLARRRRLNRTALFCFASVFGALGLMRLSFLSANLVSQLVWMVALGSLMLALTQTRTGGANVPTWRTFQWLGSRSYSLYAVHFPIALLTWAFVARLGLSRIPEIVLTIGIGLSLSLAAASASYLLVERPSLRHSRGDPRRTRQAPNGPRGERGSLPAA